MLGALAVSVAGCSSDTSRFGNPNASPYATRTAAPAETTSSIQAAPTSRISSQPLPPPPNAARPASVAPVGIAGGGGGLGSYSQPAPAPVRASLPPPAQREVTGSIPRQPQPNRQWNWDGGTAIVVGSGETAEILANRYGVPSGAILQANGLRSPAEIHPGQRLVIPKFNLASNAAPAPMPAQPSPHHYAPPPPAAPAGTGANVHIVTRGETLMSISRRYHKPVAQIAAANNIAPQAHLKVGDRIFIPGRLAETRAVAPPAPSAPRLQAPHAQAPVPHPVTTAEAAPAAARVADAGPRATAAAAPTAIKAPAFSWPVRGRVIATFGGMPNGQRNDGIDLAVPVGTDVHAADDGIVAYAGHELKGYGNLILIRHESTGFVTAYANTSEILVKRNERVHRGQVIAKSGQTGGVAVPQLHFEIRKGSAPVDPSQYLPTGSST